MNRNQSVLVVAGLACAFGLAENRAAADVIEIVASRDNTLYEASAGTLSNGSGQYIFAGATLRNSSRYRRALLYFDVSVIPAGAQIADASLRLYMSQTIAGDVPVTLHKVTKAWGEGASMAGGSEGSGGDAEPGDATWLHTFYPGTFWTNPGGDFDPTPVSGIQVGGSGFYTWSTNASMVLLVNDWVATPNQNFGVLVLGDESTNGTAKRFDSRENVTVANRPTLVVTYTLCTPDFNGDGFIDFTDFDAFVAAFEAGTSGADFNDDGFLDFTDFDAFVSAFEAGC